MSKIHLEKKVSGYKVQHPIPVIKDVSVMSPDAQHSIHEPQIAVVDTGSDITTFPEGWERILKLPKAVCGHDPEDDDEDSDLIAVLLYSIAFRLCDQNVVTKYGSPSRTKHVRLGRDVLSRADLTISWLSKHNSRLVIEEEN
jgi:hypothetical protein